KESSAPGLANRVCQDVYMRNIPRANWLNVSAIALCIMLFWLTTTSPAANDGWLSGTIRAVGGGSLEGVVVSAQVSGEAITTSVFTDSDGRYFFPAMKAAPYHVRAQVIGYEESEADIALGPQVQKVNFALKQTGDLIPQLSGYQ